LGGLLLHHQVWFESAAEFGVDFDPDRAPGDDTYANIFLVHGIGGIGKSWLTRRCLDLAEGMPIDLPDNLPILTLYEDVSHGAPVLEPVHLLDRLRDHLDQAGYRVHLAGYRQAQAELPGLVDRVMRYQFEHRELWDDSLRIAAELVARSNPEAGHRSYADISLAFSHVSGAEATGKDASTLARAYDLLLERMESEQILDTTEVALFRNPPAAQAAQLADALKHISRLRPLVIGLDNLELIVSLEPLIRDCLVLPTNHAPIIWLLSSRYNLADERLVEINAEQRIYKGYRDLLGENPPVVWDMSIFGDADLRDYLQAESERRRISLVVDDPLVEAVKSTSSGVPLVVEMVADALFTMDRDDFLRDFALDDKSLLPGDRLDRITSRFLRYCLTQAEDLARVQAMALLRKGSDAPALAAVWNLSGTQSVPEVFAGLRARYAFVLPEGLHDAVYEFVRRQLRTTRQANEFRDRLSHRAVNHYRAKWQALHDQFDDPTLRVRDPNWQRSTRDLVNALLWHSPDEAVTFLLPRFVEGLGFDRPFSNGLLIQAEEFLTGSIATFSQSYANLLHRMRMGLQDIEWVFDEPGEAIGAMVDMLLEAPNLDPLHLSILYLWQGNWLAENGHYDAALTAYFEADQHRSADAAGLGRQLARAFYELSSRFLWPESAAETVPSEPGLQAAQRAVELDPEHGAAWFNLGVALDYLGQLEKSVPAYERAIEIEPRPVHYNNLGDVYSALGREDEAESAFESALELEPTYAWPFHSLGQMFAGPGLLSAGD
jgi:tetratricopeptide (TPR) repeat protein